MPSQLPVETVTALRAFLAAIVESSEDAIIGSAADGHILSWNRGAEQIYGYAAGEVLGRPLTVLALPERRDEVVGMLTRIQGGERVTHFETMHLRKDGRVISVSLSLSPIVDRLGLVMGASWIARDVTRRIRYEESLREAEQKYRLLFTAGSDAILVADGETGRLVDYNEAALQLYDYPPEAFSRLHLNDLVMAVDSTPPPEPGAGGGLVRLPLERHRKRDGSLFPAEMSTGSFIWKGRRLQVGIVRDLSEVQRSRELRQALRMASEIQRHLLPQAAPEVPGFELAAKSRYCEDTGGDYYDFVALDDGGGERFGCVVGDVSGHGIAAALLMAMVKGALRAGVERFGPNLSGLFLALNRLLIRHLQDDRFMTLFFGAFDSRERTLTWNSAGHGPIFHYRRREGRIDELATTGPPLGTLETVDFSPLGPLQLDSGDLILIGTDGLWEARNPQGEMFGTSRLRQLLATWAHRPATEILQTILGRVDGFCAPGRPEDDLTLIVIKVL